jgi:predicted amidohydrolase
MKIAMLQMNSRDNKLHNLDAIEALFRKHITPGDVDLVVAPEYATFLGGTKEAQWDAAETLSERGLKVLFDPLDDAQTTAFIQTLNTLACWVDSDSFTEASAQIHPGHDTD